MGADLLDMQVCEEHSGIGLNNITKRLDLLFGNRYLLDIDDKDQSRYIVKLVIPVNF